MKTGRTIQDLATEIQRQQETKRDFVAPTEKLQFVQAGTNGSTRTVLRMDKGEEIELFGMTDHFHAQVGDRLKIPGRYYRRMREEAPDLLADNVNHWMTNSGENRMVRTLDGDARAFLSDRFRPMDNFDLAEAVLPILLEGDGMRVESCEITPRRMYLKVVNERVQGEVKKGDVVQAGVAISNSEIGSGALSISPLLFRLVCLNGMISTDQSLRKFHTGRRQGGEEGSWEVFSDATKNLSDAALWAQVRDLTKAALNEALFKDQLRKAQQAAGEAITGDPIKVIEVVQKKLDLTDNERGGVLRNLISGGDLSKWGLTNALTAYSQEVDDYDRATEFEAFGGRVIEMEPKAWREIAEAAA